MKTPESSQFTFTLPLSPTATAELTVSGAFEADDIKTLVQFLMMAERVLLKAVAQSHQPEYLGPEPACTGPSTCWGVRINGACEAHPFGCPEKPA